MTLHSPLPLADEIGPESSPTCICGHSGDDHTYDVDSVCLLCDCPQYSHAEVGSGTVALFLAAILLLGMVLLAVVAGRAGMCTLHDEELRYCDGYEQVTS